MPLFGQIHIDTTVGTQASADVDLPIQTINIGPALLTGAADGTTTQAAINAIIADLNDLKAKLRAAGILAS